MFRGARYVMKHNGAEGCGQTFLYFRVRPEPEGPLAAQNIIWPDGTNAQDGDPFVCGSCKGHAEEGRTLEILEIFCKY